MAGGKLGKRARFKTFVEGQEAWSLVAVGTARIKAEDGMAKDRYGARRI